MDLVSSNRQLCVPVRKNNQLIPPAALDIIQWVDLEKFQALEPALITPTTIRLSHLNPLFATLPSVLVTLAKAPWLMVPVVKNGNIPPQ